MTNLKKKAKRWYHKLMASRKQSSSEISVGRKILRAMARFVLSLEVTWREFKEDALPQRAMMLTFITMIALAPLLIVSVTLFKLFTGPGWFDEVVRPELIEILAPGSGKAIADRISMLIENARGGTFSGVSVILITMGVFGIFSQIEATFNHIWGMRKAGLDLSRIPVYLGIIVIVPVAIIISFTVSTYITALPLISQAVEHISVAAKLINWFVPFLLLTFAFFILYRFLPRVRVRNRSAILGAIIAGVLHELLKNGFIFYTSQIVSYDVLYGSLSIIPVLLIWINLSWVAVLIGVEISFVRQHWDVLIDRRKHVALSRSQSDALSYLLLFEATGAFRNNRSQVTIEEWSNHGLPPSIISEALENLEEAGLLKQTDDGLILLTRDPSMVRMSEIDQILAGERNNEWYWPEEPPWNWLRQWMNLRQAAAEQATDVETLDGFVERLEQEALNEEQLQQLAEEHNESEEDAVGLQEGTSRHPA